MPRRAAASQKIVRLICWNEADAAERAIVLRQTGYHVLAEPPQASGGMIRYFRELDPDAVVIDLDRLPSYGRELALGLRASRSTCHLPLIFAGGVPAKIAMVRSALPDATFVAWTDDLSAAIEHAMHLPAPARIASRELPKATGPGSLERKLDIKPQTHFAIVPSRRAGNPLADLLTDVPGTAVEQRRIDAKTTLALYAVATRGELMQAFVQARTALPPKASLWIVHPKQSSALAADFNQDDVRESGLALGFVDYKVCAVDKDWSALKFARRAVAEAKPHAMR